MARAPVVILDHEGEFEDKSHVLKKKKKSVVGNRKSAGNMYKI